MNLQDMFDDNKSSKKFCVLSEETRAKISAANNGKTLTEKTRAKMSAARKGTTLTEKTRAKIGAAHKGKTITEEQRAKISKTRKQDSKRMRTPLGDFDSLADAARAHNVHIKTLRYRLSKNKEGYSLYRQQ